MARYASWLLNVGLAGLACFLLAQSVDSVLAALLTTAPTGEPGTAAAAAPASARSWSDREVILTRNLFNASTLVPAVASEQEVLEATKLPLNLLGTAAAEDAELSWAAVEDRDSQQTLVLAIGDSVRNQAQVRRIERKRIVLEEQGALRELALEEPAALPTLPPEPSSRLATRGGRARSAAPELPAALEGPRSPARLFSEARILPKYEAGQMVGVQVSAIKPGSIFEEMGVQEGEIITALNGIRIDSPEQSAKILLELTKPEPFTVEVEGTGGRRTLTWEMER